MRKSITLSINKPCSEKFNQFTATEKGGFCSSCTKEVIDFTKMSSEEIQKYFSTTKNNTCGRFNKYQLKAYTEPLTTKQQSKFNFFGAIGLTTIALLISPSTSAQNKVSTVKTENSIKKNKEENQAQGTITITGSIYSSVDKYPLPGVSVILKNSTKGIDTDFDGNFKLENLKIGDLILISYLGYKTKEITVENTNTLEIYLEEDNYELLGEVQTKEHYKTKRSLFQKIKSIF